MIHFFSNHKDTSAIEAITGEPVNVIPHPYIEPEWTVEDVKRNCEKQIAAAVFAERLIINGDYTLVSLILLARRRLGKSTGFLCMKKINEPCSEKDSDGNIIHRNILKPVNVRWI